MGTIYERLPFGPAPTVDGHAWGIWDRRRKCWMLRPRFADEAIDGIAEAMREAYAAGFGDAKIERARASLAPARRNRRRDPPHDEPQPA